MNFPAFPSAIKLMVNLCEKLLQVSWKARLQPQHLFLTAEEETLQPIFPVESSSLLSDDLLSAVGSELRLHQPARAAGS